MQISEIMTKGVECIQPDDTIASAAERMRDLGVGVLPICGAGDKLVGMITDRDIAVRAVAGARDPLATYVEEIMTPELIYCFDDQDLGEAAQLMEDHQVRRLVVLTRDKRLAGIVSLGDLAVKSHNEHLCAEALERVSEPIGPRF